MNNLFISSPYGYDFHWSVYTSIFDSHLTFYPTESEKESNAGNWSFTAHISADSSFVHCVFQKCTLVSYRQCNFVEHVAHLGLVYAKQDNNLESR